MTFEKGKAYTIHISALGESRKAHIVELIENDMIVYKYFGKHKQWWHYFVQSRSELEHYFKLGKKMKGIKVKYGYNPPDQ